MYFTEAGLYMASVIKITPSSVAFNGINGVSILDSALSAGVVLRHSCKNGSCGLCESKIISGEVIDNTGHRYQSGEYFLTCQCEPAMASIVIDAEYYPELSTQTRKVIPCKVSSIIKKNDFLIIWLRIPPSIHFSYLPGQFINLSFQGVSRSYSIANANAKDGVELHIRRVVDGEMSNLLFSQLKVDTLMRLDGPIGTFFVRDDTRPIIFLAGGTGFAPIKAMVESLLQSGSSRQLFIYWGMRSSHEFYSSLPSEWAEQFKQVRFVPVVSESDAKWFGRSGYVHQAVLQDIECLSDYCVYACGSSHMIDAAKGDFLKFGLPEKQFFSDVFTVSK